MAGTHSVPRDYHPALFAEGAFGEMFAGLSQHHGKLAADGKRSFRRNDLDPVQKWDPTALLRFCSQ
jgi:hypothetical protein